MGSVRTPKDPILVDIKKIACLISQPFQLPYDLYCQHILRFVPMCSIIFQVNLYFYHTERFFKLRTDPNTFCILSITE